MQRWYRLISSTERNRLLPNPVEADTEGSRLGRRPIAEIQEYSMKAVPVMTRTLAVVLAALLMTGCSLRLPGIGVDIGDGGGHHGGNHCPPGQAKKGNC